MTLSAYLNLLSLGNTGEEQSPTNEQADKEIREARCLARAISQAEMDVITAVSRHGVPTEEREAKENMAGVSLAAGTMFVNYALSFPLVVTRHRLQTFSHGESWRKDTPVYCARQLWHSYKTRGLSSLYSGLGLGLLGQGTSALYDTLVIEPVLNSIKPGHHRTWIGWSAYNALNLMLDFSVHALTFPLYRNALIHRVRPIDTSFSASPNTSLIRSLWPPTYLSFSPMSIFLPSCMLKIVTDKIASFLFRRLYQLFAPPHLKKRRHPRPHQRRSHRQATTASPATALTDAEAPSTPAVPSEGDWVTVDRSNHAEHRSRSKKEDIPMLHTFYPDIVCGIASNIITRSISYPVDTILFKLMLQDSGLCKVPTNYDGFFDCATRIWTEGGWQAFYAGWGAGVLEVLMGYIVLEMSWFAYCIVDQNLGAYYFKEPRFMKKVRHIRVRMEHM